MQLHHNLLPDDACLDNYFISNCIPHLCKITLNTRHAKITIIQAEANHSICMIWLWVKLCWFEKRILYDGTNFFQHICTQLIFCQQHTIHEHTVCLSHHYHFFFTIRECHSSSLVCWKFQICLWWEQFCCLFHLGNDSWRQSHRRCWRCFCRLSYGCLWCLWWCCFFIFLFTFWRSFSTSSAGWVIVIVIRSCSSWQMQFNELLLLFIIIIWFLFLQLQEKAALLWLFGGYVLFPFQPKKKKKR